MELDLIWVPSQLRREVSLPTFNIHARTHVVCNLEAHRTPGEGDDGIAMVGAVDEAGVLSNLSWKNRQNHRCSFTCARLVGAASDNKPMRGRMREGCWLNVSWGISHLPTRLEA